MVRLKRIDDTDAQQAYEATEAALTAVASSIHPALGAAFGMAAALFGPAIIRRQDRVTDLLYFVREHPEVFTQEIMATQEFQDGFVYFTEKYIRERNQEKLVIMRNILRGFAQTSVSNNYPLEEMCDLLSRLRFADIALLRTAIIEDKQQQELMPPYNQQSFKLNENPFNVSRVVYFGLLAEDRTKSGAIVREHPNPGFLYVRVSSIGWQFAKYIENSDINRKVLKG